MLAWGVRWYLDFDGVLCDSMAEIWASSHRALGLGAEPWETVSEDLRRRFSRLRPFIRVGAEYLAIVELLHQGQDARIQSFADWERHLKELGPRLDEHRERLYAVRREWLSRDPEGWTGLNPPYPGAAPLLKRVAACPRVSILSTKRAPFVAAILGSWGVSWNFERIEEATGHKALILEARGEPYTLVDDQVEHLLPRPRWGRCVLALWGHVTAEARERAPLAWTWEEFERELLGDVLSDAGDQGP